MGQGAFSGRRAAQESKREETNGREQRTAKDEMTTRLEENVAAILEANHAIDRVLKLLAVCGDRLSNGARSAGR